MRLPPFLVILFLMNRESIAAAERLTSFIVSSPSPYHVLDNAEKMLLDGGFIPLSEKKSFNIERGKSYFVKRSSSALIAFRVPENPSLFRIAASHTDSPCFKIKWNPVVKGNGMPSRLNVESYGGLLVYTWLDRPLSAAGRIFYRKDGEIVEKHVDLSSSLSLVIPSLAIHQNREANNGWKISLQKEMLPLFCDGDESFDELLASICGVEKNDIVDADLFLYNRTMPSFSGRRSEYFSSPKIDDLECVFTSLEAVIETESRNAISMVALFDNEETGSGTKEGALSDFLTSVIERIAFSLGWNAEGKYMALASSFMLSADNGHAVHPSYPEKSDITNRPRMNGGVLLKYASSQKYTTSGESGAFTRSLLEKNGIPYQIFYNNSDMAGGSTLGNLSTQKVSILTSDIGCAQLAMHSSYETAGTEDVLHLKKLFKAFLSE